MYSVYEGWELAREIDRDRERQTEIDRNTETENWRQREQVIGKGLYSLKIHWGSTHKIHHNHGTLLIQRDILARHIGIRL